MNRKAAFQTAGITCLILSLAHAMLGQRTSKPADLVVINANIRTMVSPDSRAGAVAVAGDRVIAVGTTKDISKLVGPRTRVLDARGRLLVPGFNDAHVHFMGIGNMFSSLDLRSVKNADEVLERIRHYVRFIPKGRWILGSGWTNESWKPPDRTAVDTISADNPILLFHADGKSAYANSNALGRAQIKGSESGIVQGDALAKIRAIVPRDHTRNWLEIAETATNYAASLGVTSIQDMHSDDSREIYRELRRQGKLKTRIYDCIPLPDFRKLTTADGADNMVRGGCLKSLSDGEEESAARLLRDVVPADKAGLQVMIHAIGSRANGIVLDVFERTGVANPRRDRRFRIEHANGARPEDLPRFSRSGIVASMQPHLFYGGSGGYYRTLLDSKTHLAFGSDAAITDLNPLFGIHAAVNSGPESISVYEAVRAYTAGSAYAEFQEKQKGTIEPGKLADFVILSDDIFAVRPLKIRDVTIATTILGGKVVFGSNQDVE